jgi:uncharacterized protein (TIGR03437 family)
LNRHLLIGLAATLVGVLAPQASAQTPANITVSLGDGQLICDRCAFRGGPFFFQNIYAIVTDANGNPIANYPVSWAVTSGPGNVTSSTSYTDSTGTASTLPVSPATSYGFQNFYQQIVVSATAGSVSTTFTESNALVDSSGNQMVFTDFSQAPLGTPLSGNAGSAGTPFTVRVYQQFGGGIPGVSVRLYNVADGTSGPSLTLPSAYCQGQQGADPYSVMTNSAGIATCTPVFGPVAGSGQVAILVGGLPAGQWSDGKSIPGVPAGALYVPTGSPVYSPGSNFVLPGFQNSGPINVSVTAAAIGSVAVTSGNGQSANPGQALASPLVATVKDPNGNPLANQTVNWTVSPTGAATLSSTSGVSGSNGQVSTNVTFSASANGTVTIKATSASNSGASASFTATAVPPVTIISLTKIGGDSQSAVVGAAFPTPLQVQVAVSGGSAANIPVSFSATGPITLSANSASTNANGIAQVTATAGSTTGSATVTASVGGISQVFNLAVTPAAPPITASNFVNGADQQKGSITACGLAAISVPGINPAVSGTINGPLVGLLPLTLGNTTVAFNGTDYAPIVSVSENGVTFQLPCDVTPGTVPVTVNLSGAIVTVNVNVLPAGPGIFSTVQTDGVSRAVIERPDGSFVSLSNPARRGENVTAFVTGLGPVSPSVGTNALPIPGTASTVNGQVIVGVNNAGTTVLASQLSPDRQGIYTITFQIPQNAPQANNVAFSIGVVPVGSSTVYYSAGSQIPIQ